MQRLPIVFFMTTLKYEQTAKDYRHLRKEFNVKNIDFFKRRKKLIGGRFAERNKFLKIIHIFSEVRKYIASTEQEKMGKKKSLENKNNNSSSWKLNKQVQLNRRIYW